MMSLTLYLFTFLVADLVVVAFFFSSKILREFLS